MTVPCALSRLRTIVGTTGYKDALADMAPYLTERRRLFDAQAAAVVLPRNTAQVAAVVDACREGGLSIVPQGGNTGLCGGAVPSDRERHIVLNLSRMRRIRAVDAADFSLTAEAGCVLTAVQRAALEADRFFPLSLAAEGSCQIGGVLSTNAGGNNVLRYGNARDLVIGLEVVLADGRIWEGLSRLRKDNTGYDLKQLFLGAEGTLGIITAATLKLFPRPRDYATALVALAEPAQALALYQVAQGRAGESLTGCELISATAMALVLKHGRDCRTPFDVGHPWYLLLELSSARAGDGLTALLERLLQEELQRGHLADAVVARSARERAELWRLRESIPEAQRQEGASIKHDVSVPVSRIPELIERGTDLVLREDPEVRVCPFGHLGDGNLHFNLSQPPVMSSADFLAQWQHYNRLVHDLVAELGGSFSAEHGIGRLKVADLTRYGDPVKLDLMRRLKRELDPDDLFNPGKVLS